MKKALILHTLFLAFLTIQAQQVSRQQALATAQQFFAKKGKTMRSSAPLLAAPRRQAAKAPGTTAASGNPQATPGATTSPDNTAYYIFNVGGENGFVIVSGDERTIAPVLGYSDSGHFDQENIPYNLRAWLDGYAEEIGSLTSTSPQSIVPHIDFPVVKPLLTTKWDQGTPYNNQCPIKNGEHCVTGCVPTALAQIMNYWKYPAVLKAPSWSDLPDRAMDWSNIKDRYDTNESADEVAWLMRYLGERFVGYDTSGSYGDFNYSISTDFGYNKYICDILKGDNYTNTDWVELIKRELLAKRPIYYAAASSGDFSHAFVLDGSDGNGYYHFNLGYGGQYDGYYLCTAVKDYVRAQRMLIGITPENEIIYRKGWIKVNTNGLLSCTIGTEPVSVFPSVYTLFPEGKIGIGELQENGSINVLYSPGMTEKRLEIYMQNWKDELFASKPDGTYKLATVFKADDSHPWVNVCSKDEYLLVQKRGNNITYQQHDFSIKDYDDFSYSVNTKGEAKVNGAMEAQVTLCNNRQTQDLYGKLTVYNTDKTKSTGAVVNMFPGGTQTFSLDLRKALTIDHTGTYKYRLEWTSYGLRDNNYNLITTDLGEHSFNIYGDIIDGDYQFCITSDADKTAEIYSHNNREVNGELTLPSELNFNGNTYRITTIGECAIQYHKNISTIIIPESVTELDYGAFRGCSSLSTITLPNSIEKIKNFCFESCYNLKQLYSLNPTPPELDLYSLADIRDIDCVLYVPKEAVEAYKSDNLWNKMNKIRAIGETSGGDEGENDNGDKTQLIFYYGDLTMTVGDIYDEIFVTNEKGNVLLCNIASSDESIVVADRSNVTAVRPGTATLYATHNYLPGVTGECKVTVNQRNENNILTQGSAGTMPPYNVEACDTERDFTICAWGKTNAGAPYTAYTDYDEGNMVFFVPATDCPEPEQDYSAWDNQFWIEAPQEFHEGDVVRISFRYKASQETNVETQVHRQCPGDYLHWEAIGNVHFTTDWQTTERELTINKDQDGMWSIAFNLNSEIKTATTFYFDDLCWEVLYTAPSKPDEPETPVDRGDVNGDGNIDTTDLSLAVEYVMGRTPDGASFQAADANGDGSVDIADLATIVEIILSQK